LEHSLEEIGPSWFIDRYV